MSFRLFVYYCAMCGGCSAYVAWALGKAISVSNRVLEAGMKGLLLGMLIGMGLAAVDAFWNSSTKRPFIALARIIVGFILGCLAGFFGGVIGQAFLSWLNLSLFFVFGWTLTGFLVGASLGVYDFLDRIFSNQELGGARRKILNGVMGGSVGGFLGGIAHRHCAASSDRCGYRRPRGEGDAVRRRGCGPIGSHHRPFLDHRRPGAPRTQ